MPIIWDHNIDWAGGYNVSRSYKTERFVSGGLREQRRALRNVARQAVEFRLTLHSDAMRKFRMDMLGNHGQEFIYPMLHTTVLTTSSIPVGGSTVVVAEPVSGVVIGSTVVVQSGSTIGTFTISGISGSTYTLSPVSPAAFPAGSKISKAAVGHLRSATSADSQTSNVGVAQIRFDALPSSVPRVEPASAALTYNGFEVFNIKPNWSAPLKLVADQQLDVLDFDRGQVSISRRTNFGSAINTMKFTAKNRNVAATIDAVFDRAYGARGEFYCPTWMDDMAIVSNLTSGGTTMVVSGRRLYDTMLGSTVYRNIYMQLKTGDYLMRRITGITLSGDNSVVTVDQAWPYAIAVGAVAKISWLLRSVFASDTITWTWITSRVAETTLSVRTVEDLT